MLSFVISSSVLILILLICRKLFRGRISFRLQYGLWLLVAIRLLIPVQFGHSSFSIQNWVDPITTHKTSAPISNVEYAEPIQQATVGSSVIQQPQAELTDPLPTYQGSQQVQTDLGHARSISWQTVLNSLWLGGSVSMAVWFLAVNLRFARNAKKGAKSHPVADYPLQVYESENIPSPCLLGLFPPKVYILPNEDRSGETHILTHELTHYRHGDHLWSVLRVLCLCLHWYNPLVWIAAHSSAQDCELACDEGTLKTLGEAQRLAYGKTLLQTAANSASFYDVLQTATTLGRGKQQIKERLEMILRKPKKLLIVLIALLLVTVLAVGCTFTGSKEKAVPHETFTYEDLGFCLDIPETWQGRYSLERAGDSVTVTVDGTLRFALYSAVDARPYNNPEDDLFSKGFTLFEEQAHHKVYLKVFEALPEDLSWNSTGSEGLSTVTANDVSILFRSIEPVQPESPTEPQFATEEEFAKASTLSFLDKYTAYTFLCEEADLRPYTTAVLDKKIYNRIVYYYTASNSFSATRNYLRISDIGENSQFVLNKAEHIHNLRKNQGLVLEDFEAEYTVRLVDFDEDQFFARVLVVEQKSFRYAGETVTSSLEDYYEVFLYRWNDAWYVYEMFSDDSFEYDLRTKEISATAPTETEEVTETPTEVAFTPVDAENPVVEAFAGTYSQGFATINYSIPRIQCESTYAQAINQELAGFYYNYINEEGYYGGSKSFDWYINGDVLSVVVYHFNNDFDHQYTVPGSESEWDFRHSIYNIRMSDGSPVTNEEILQLAGVSAEVFRTRAQKILGNSYIIKSLPPASAEFAYNNLLEGGESGWTYECFCKSVSDENLDLIEVFLGENGVLYFMGRRYWIAGGFEYATPLFDYFAEFEVSPYYEVFFANIP